jgi:dihydrofolate reductase
MTEVLCTISMSVDGYVAGPNQTLERPFGGNGDIEGRLHPWMFEREEENAAELEAMSGASAYVMGRNMFSPDRGEWDPEWKAAAGDGYVLIPGGAATVNQYLRAGLIDELWLHVAPVLLGAGENLFDAVPVTDLEKVEVRDTELVTHLRYRVARSPST